MRHLLSCYFVNIHKVTFKWTSSVFSGKCDNVCLVFTSILKSQWQTELMLTESGVVQNPLCTVTGFYLFCLTLSSRTHSASLFLTSSLNFFAVVLSLIFPFSFFLFSVFLYLSFDCQAVQFSKLWIIYRGCSEFLELCGHCTTIFSEVYQFCSVLTCVTRLLHRGRLVEWADRSLMRGRPDRQQGERAKAS